MYYCICSQSALQYQLKVHLGSRSGETGTVIHLTVLLWVTLGQEERGNFPIGDTDDNKNPTKKLTSLSPNQESHRRFFFHVLVYIGVQCVYPTQCVIMADPTCTVSVCRVTGGELFEDIVAREYYSEADARSVHSTNSKGQHLSYYLFFLERSSLTQQRKCHTSLKQSLN